MTVTTRAGGPSSGNPALSDTRIGPLFAELSDRSMTVIGTASKTLIFLVILIAGGAWGWASATESVATDLGGGYANTTVTIPGGFWLASFGALFVGILATVNPRRAALFGAVYAVLEGYVLGAISAMFDAQTQGVVGAAVLATVCVFGAALFLYLTRIIRPTQKLAFGVAAGIGGLALLYFFVFIVSLFNWEWLYSDQFRTIGVIVSVLAVILAALSLTLDFGAIEAGVAAGAPKEVEWYMAFSLMVTIVWLYITLLRLLAWAARNN